MVKKSTHNIKTQIIEGFQMARININFDSKQYALTHPSDQIFGEFENLPGKEQPMVWGK
jgi:hypothetical protein